MKSLKTGIIILAAGSSSRLGKPKQLLAYKGKTLINRAINAALGSEADSCILVLGANFELISHEIQDTNVDTVINHDWEKGMSSGMQKGLDFLENKIDLDQVIIMLCDQPFVDWELLKSLVHKQAETGKGIIACHYNGTFGVPVLFSRKYFQELNNLKGSEGAKKVIYSHPEDMERIEFPDAAIDIDTLDDYKRLTREN